MADLSTLHVDTVRTEITWNNLLDFPAKHGFTPSQRLVLTKWVAREGSPGWALHRAADVCEWQEGTDGLQKAQIFPYR